jgi:hypothetical protein
VEGNAFSEEYQLKVVAVPTIANFEMQLNYPLYLNRKSEVVNGTGNAIIPEGTKVTWKVSALATQNIYWSNETTRFSLLKKLCFLLSKSIGQSIDYQIVTSNERIKDHENSSIS